MSLMIFRLELKHTERMLDINSGYLRVLSPDKFILLVFNKHNTTLTPNIQHCKTSSEYIPET
jgi:hypothetical protein